MLPLYLPLSHTGVNDRMLVMYNYKHMITNSLMGKEEVMNHAETEQLDIESSTLRSAKGLEKLRYVTANNFPTPVVFLYFGVLLCKCSVPHIFIFKHFGWA